MASFTLLTILSLVIEGNHALLQPSHLPIIHRRIPSIISRRPSALSATSSSSSAASADNKQQQRRVKIRAQVNKGGSSISSGGGSNSATLTKTRTKRKSTTTSTATKTTKSTKRKNKSTTNKSKESSSSSSSSSEPLQQQSKKKADKKEEELPPPRYFIKSPTIHTKSGAPWQHQEMMDHTILTKDEELILGRQVVRAAELRIQIMDLLEERRVERAMRQLEMEQLAISIDEDELLSLGEAQEVEGVTIEGGGGDNNAHHDVDYDFLSYELEYLSVYGFRPTPKSTPKLQDLDLEDDLLIDHAQHRSKHISQLRSQEEESVNGEVHERFVGSNTKRGPKRNGYRNGSSSGAAASGSSSAAQQRQRNSYTPLLHIPLHELSESDVIQHLEIPGGHTQLTDILLDGAHARETLMRKNVKLVMSIAKNWMRNSFTTANANHGKTGEGGSNGGSGRNDKGTKKYLAQMYEGSWDKPSLDETVQEGMLGLARAVDKYDPERGLRFSTYATHWITSYVRVCFQRAVTGCLRVPSQLHDIKSAHNKIVRDSLHLGNDPPEQKNIAEQLGITEQRLSTAIRATGSLVSVDAPVNVGGSGSYKGSMAGGDGSNSQELLILDTLKCAEPKPEDQVEISFLRQCLENAMATELTPYERDILRLRLGLDSGEGKTVRQIVEISGGSISMSDVRSAERRAFKKLRSPTSVHTHNLLAYLDLAGA